LDLDTLIESTSSLSLVKSTTTTGYGMAGQTIPYSYLLTNNGSTTLTGVSVNDTKNAVSCPASTLAPGGSETCTGTYTLTQGDVDAGSVTNSATATGNTQPANSLLTHVMWSNFRATDPTAAGYPPTSCTQDWSNGYTGPDIGGGSACAPIFFGPSDQIHGPIFSNDSIYVDGDPTLGPVQTADPSCLYVTGTSGQSQSCATSDNSNGTQLVTQSPADAAADAYGQPLEPLPVTNSALETDAALGGCLYQGPTTITLDPNDQMTVWSPDSSISAKCLPAQGGTVDVPNGPNGNGVVYVDSAATACAAGANPFDDWTGSTFGPQAQLDYDGTYQNFLGATAQPDCEGDAFVSDNPSGGGVSGPLTIATDNNVVVTGSIEYEDCGPTFDSTVNHPCPYNSSNSNDVLGLIPANYAEVSHPVQPSCTTSGGQHPRTTCVGVNPNSALEPHCTTAQLGTPAAALCDPGPNLTIDAAITALNHSFAVNNEDVVGSTGGFGAGPPDGTLTVYGAVDQNWTGAVGILGSGGSISGYVKDYDWDSRLPMTSPPDFLSPGSTTTPQTVVSNFSTVTVPASSATSSITLTKSTTSTGYSSAGETIPYDYLVTNTGTTTLTGVSVSDNKNAVNCPSEIVAPDADEMCTGTYTVTQSDVSNGSVTNSATASGTDPQGQVVTSAPSLVTLSAEGCDPPIITSPTSATAVAGTPFTFTVTTCTATSPKIRGYLLPKGLHLIDNGNGSATISGTPGIHDGGVSLATITAQVKGQPVASQTFSLAIDNVPVFKSKPRFLAHSGTAFAYSVTTLYGYPLPTLTTASTLPAGVSLVDNGNGTASLTGTPGPNTGGVYPLTLTATNGVGSPVTQTFMLTVYQAPVITSADSDSTPAGVAMTPFTATDTGYPTAKLTAAGLPYGVKLTDNHNLTGTIAGTTRATADGVYVVTITASGKAGSTIETFTLTVN